MKWFCFVVMFWGASIFAGSQAIEELVYTIRDPKTKAAPFRKALEKIGEYLALDVLEEMRTQKVDVETLTGAKAEHFLLDETPVLVTILRAGLPLHAGVQKVFSNAESGFLAMSRNEETLKADVSYIALPNLKGKTVILTDTMLATGGSLLDAIQIIEQKGPAEIFVIAAIAAEAGIARILAYDSKIKIIAAAIDPLLNEKGYIVPGLGDAGDRCYGEKHSF